MSACFWGYHLLVTFGVYFAVALGFVIVVLAFAGWLYLLVVAY